MSAICGIVRFDGKPVESDELETMVESSPYRGPDGVGYHLHENAGFTHLAFHLTPESVHEKQPLISEDGRLVLVADVRLDNREALFGKLELKQDPDRVVTDPELILLAFRKWGRACVEHFLGDFVFSIWDKRAKTLFLARDPLGAYSVTYHQAGKCFAFASETTAILDLPFVEPVINEERVLREIEFLPRSHEETFFKSIFYLPPAHCMEVSAEGQKLWRYWDIDPVFHTSYKTDDEYADHLLELVDQATACRMRCIGPVGISLSGGRDSTLVAAGAARQFASSQLSQKRLMSFSYVFDELKDCDERKYIEPVVEQYELDAHHIRADDLWTFRHFETQPVARDYLWTNCFVNLPLSIAHSARQNGCRLLFNGEVGDALFGGSNQYISEMLRKGQFVSLLSYLKRHSGEIDWYKDVILRGAGSMAPDWLHKPYRKARAKRQPSFVKGLTTARKQQVENIRNTNTSITYPEGLRPGSVRRYSSVLNASWAQGFAATRSLGYNRFGIEQTSPLYDQRIVEFVLSVPENFINKPGKNRFLQTNSMKKVLPAEVYKRTDKTSFEALVRIGLFEQEKETALKLLENSQITLLDWVDQRWLDNQLASFEKPDDSGYPLSSCLHLESWLRAIKQPLENMERWSDFRPPLT